jgi:tripartite-type tricarboxylate transporter receptor subunit TctC
MSGVLLLGFAFACAAAQAQTFPQRPVVLVNPASAGGTLDTVLRMLAQKMAGPLGQPVVVENRTGAGGMLAYASVAKASPDGHVLLSVANTFAVNMAVRKDLPYDALKDFAPITFIGSTPHVLAVHASSPANNVADLVALAKRNPGAISYGTFGDGSYSHLVGKMFEQAAHVELLQVPFRGSAPSIVAVVSNQISMVFGNFPEIMPHVRAGRLKALAIAMPQRSPLAPELPTVAEAGYPGFSSLSWYGLVAPAGTPAAIVDRLQKEVAHALALPDVKERLNALGVVSGGGSPQEFGAYLHEQIDAYARIVRDAHIKLAN